MASGPERIAPAVCSVMGYPPVTESTILFDCVKFWRGCQTSFLVGREGLDQIEDTLADRRIRDAVIGPDEIERFAAVKAGIIAEALLPLSEAAQWKRCRRWCGAPDGFR